MGTKRLSHKRYVLLVRAATNCGARPRGPRGSTIDYELSHGFDDQLDWALNENLVEECPRGRLIITDKGRQILEKAK